MLNSIYIRIGVAALLSSVKNAERRELLKGTCKDVVQGILLAYADDEDFIEGLTEPEV